MAADSKKLKLVLNSGKYTTEDGDTYTGYGFTAFTSDPPREIFSIEDLSVHEDEVRILMRSILDYDVSVTHFQDLIDDFFV